MIESIVITETLNNYLDECRQNRCKPTYKGLGRALGVSDITIKNIFTGKYNGIRYSDTPSHNRRIDNTDFDQIQDVFKNIKQIK